MIPGTIIFLMFVGVERMDDNNKYIYILTSVLLNFESPFISFVFNEFSRIEWQATKTTYIVMSIFTSRTLVIAIGNS